MPSDKQYWKPTGGYDFKLKIDDLDYSQDLARVKILSSITAPYQTILLTLNLDPNDIILKRLYGQSTFKLTIFLDGADNKTREQLIFDLMYITSEFQIPTRAMQTTGIQKDRSQFIVPTICIKPFEYMNTMVNQVYHAKKMDEIINDLVGNTDADIEFETTGLNTNTFDQVMVPPMTLYKSLKYLDRVLGIYNGIAIMYCLFDGTIYIKNLNQKMNMSQVFTMYQVASGDEEFKKIAEKCADGKHFYTSKEVTTTYNGNAAFSVLSPVLRYITKPKDALYKVIEKDLDEFCLEYGILSSKDSEIYHNSKVIKPDKRITYYTNQIGNGDDETFINANLSKAISSLSTLSMDMDRDMMLLNLMHVGESVLFISKTLEMNQFSGKYILKSSEINFDRGGTWEGAARIHLIRTNKSSN